jgi:hypothetical protein
MLPSSQPSGWPATHSSNMHSSPKVQLLLSLQSSSSSQGQPLAPGQTSTSPAGTSAWPRSPVAVSDVTALSAVSSVAASGSAVSPPPSEDASWLEPPSATLSLPPQPMASRARQPANHHTAM